MLVSRRNVNEKMALCEFVDFIDKKTLKFIIKMSFKQKKINIFYILSNSYHQKVPKDCPLLESKPTHGLVAPEEFNMPPLNELWTSDAYFAFDINVVNYYL